MGETRNREPGRDEAAIRRGGRVRLAWTLVVGLLAFGPGLGVVASPPSQDPPPGLPTESTDLPAAADEPADPQGATQPLSLRYKFVEQYSETPDPKHPEWLTQYQVGVREKLKMVLEKPQGTPDRVETSLQTIYTERAIKTTPNKAASDVVRRYDRAQLSTTMPMRRQFQNPKFLEQLTIWYRVKPGKPVELYNLTDGRALRQMEFDRIVENPFLPQLATLLPTTAWRVGDRWQVARGTLSVLLGELPLDEDYDVQGELIEVKETTPGSTAMTAVLGVHGQLNLMEGPVALNVRVHFEFESPKPAAAAPAATAAPRPFGAPEAKKAGVVEAAGWISEIRMTQVVTTPLPNDETGRLNQTRTRELVVARRARAADLGTEAALPLVAPEAPPEDAAHTWVTYDDHQGRFHLEHPQSLRVARAYPDGGVDLVDRRLDGRDVISLVLAPKTGDANRDRLATDPAAQRKALVEHWKGQGQDVLMGDSGWLKEDVWGPLGRKVYRLEAALRPEADAPDVRGGRIYLDRYIVQFTRNETLIVDALTTSDPHLPFRDQAEELIKRFAFGPSEKALAPLGDLTPAAPGN